MIDLRADFQERVAEVESFINLAAAIERSVQNGVPLIHSPSGGATVVEPIQQKLLYAGVYLHLYNLVEATISRCIAAVEEAASNAPHWRPGDLSIELREEWVRAEAKTHETVSTEQRLKLAMQLCAHLVEMLPVKVKIAQGGGGNWDDEEIYRFAKRLGITLRLTTAHAVKRPFREDKGALKTIKHLRNKLAHGEMSFAECGDGLSTSQLADLKKVTVDYLSEVIGCFEDFINRYEFLVPTKRPLASGG